MSLASRALFRLGLRAFEHGWLRGAFGVRWMRLETRGRRSGRAHPVLLDVIGRDPSSGTIYVQPARGRDADWFRNVLHDPHVICDSGRGSRPAVAHELAPQEAAAVLDRWVASHRRYARFVAKRLGWHGDGSAAAWLASRLPVVAITAD